MLDSLAEIVDEFDVAVIDQWGVLHNGARPYPDAPQTLRWLAEAGKPIVVLSNSGKRAAPNRARIATIGLPVEPIQEVMTSGEALWRDLTAGKVRLNGKPPRSLFPLCANPSDAEDWAAGSVDLVFDDPLAADAILAMGASEALDPKEAFETLRPALDAGVPMICSNPDKASPRDGRTVASPGAVAALYEDAGGAVTWYGKPHPPIFGAVRAIEPKVDLERFLMIGDSPEHDIAGGHAAGFQTLLVRGGLHADAFAKGASVGEISAAENAPEPDFSLDRLA